LYYRKSGSVRSALLAKGHEAATLDAVGIGDVKDLDHIRRVARQTKDTGSDNLIARGAAPTSMAECAMETTPDTRHPLESGTDGAFPGRERGRPWIAMRNRKLKIDELVRELDAWLKGGADGNTSRFFNGLELRVSRNLESTYAGTSADRPETEVYVEIPVLQ